jgi:lipopolysaccharide/colanic/teichoic acid biosynthesis glycosyltransferase
VGDQPGRGLGRWFDVPLSVAVLVVGSPLWLAIAAAVRLTSPGPVLHRSRRVGRGGTEFEHLKFRSMRVGAGPAITARGDSRITTVGRWLRSSKLDEIPQLLNVVRGEMAIVGPRPEDPRYVDPGDPVHTFVLQALPGITSRASVEYRHEERILAEADDLDAAYRTTVLPEKLRLDAEWLRARTVRADLRIVADTALAIVRRHEA